MTLEEIKRKIKSDEYDFLRTDQHLGNNIILLGLGGSYAYGTNTENSDLDIRGIALNKKEEILTNQNFDQRENQATDTVIYSFNKMISLLSGCNPNTIEILGLKPEHYIYLSPIGKELIDNSKLFLSQKAAGTFGGYAVAQFRRLENKSARVVSQEEQERHILNTIKSAEESIYERYFPMGSDDYFKLYIDKAVQPGFNTEIFMDCNFSHYPLRDYKGMWSEIHSIVKSYGRIGKRNENAMARDKLGKHMMHLIRLYIMCLDILEKEEITTYREKEHNFLMEIREGKYLNSEKQPIAEFFEMVNDYEKRLEYAKANTSLPAKPNYKEINDFMASVNERVILGKF